MRAHFVDFPDVSVNYDVALNDKDVWFVLSVTTQSETHAILLKYKKEMIHPFSLKFECIDNPSTLPSSSLVRT